MGGEKKGQGCEGGEQSPAVITSHVELSDVGIGGVVAGAEGVGVPRKNGEAYHCRDRRWRRSRGSAGTDCRIAALE